MRDRSAEERADGAARPAVFRSPIAVAVWYVWLAFAVVNLADLAWQGGGHAALVAAAVIMLATGIAYVVALRPRVIADDEAITVRNPLRDVRVPWGAVTGIDLGDSLRVHCEPHRVVHSWAVQSSRRSRLREQYRDQFREAQAARRIPGYGQTPEQARPRPSKSPGETIAIQLTELLDEARRRSAAGEPRAAVEPAGDLPVAREPSATGEPPAAAGEAPAAAAVPPGTAGRPAITWCWPAVAALAVPAVLVVLAIVIR